MWNPNTSWEKAVNTRIRNLSWQKRLFLTRVTCEIGKGTASRRNRRWFSFLNLPRPCLAVISNLPRKEWPTGDDVIPRERWKKLTWKWTLYGILSAGFFSRRKRFKKREIHSWICSLANGPGHPSWTSTIYRPCILITRVLFIPRISRS